MPTALKRVMISVPADLLEKLTVVAKHERRPMASQCLALINEALKMPKYKEILHDHSTRSEEELIADTGIDKMSVEKLRELQKVLGMLEKLKE